MCTNAVSIHEQTTISKVRCESRAHKIRSPTSSQPNSILTAVRTVTSASPFSCAPYGQLLPHLHLGLLGKVLSCSLLSLACDCVPGYNYITGCVVHEFQTASSRVSSRVSSNSITLTVTVTLTLKITLTLNKLYTNSAIADMVSVPTLPSVARLASHTVGCKRLEIMFCRLPQSVEPTCWCSTPQPVDFHPETERRTKVDPPYNSRCRQR